MEGRLQGKVAVVTGAASSIGLASTEAFLSSGSRVVLVDRDDAAVTSIRKKHGDAAIPLVLDLLDSTACSTLVPRVHWKAHQQRARIVQRYFQHSGLTSCLFAPVPVSSIFPASN
ncbi:SDR family NAD(P)-dependent oxidoreductase [Paraburkholderia caribensis]|uniref:SDR family NAD(P)-dependent oxidoreductase n=1 Tax=Paraburkholderia caribensis TaxID=75105 RepID=UPI0006D44079